MSIASAIGLASTGNVGNNSIRIHSVIFPNVELGLFSSFVPIDHTRCTLLIKMKSRDFGLSQFLSLLKNFLNDLLR